MKTLLLILLTLIFSGGIAFADVDLYSGEVVVASQSELDRNEAIPEALIRVLQKYSGKREMPESPSLDEALQNATRMLLSFRYINVDRVNPDGSLKQELRLIARFMQEEIDRVVRETGLPRWQQQRPPVQTWVLIDDGQNREFKPVEFAYAWEAMEDVAALRGLPLSWPELDEEEVQLIDTSLLWGGFTDYLIEMGAPADGVAIVAARREGQQWSLRWSLTSGNQHWNWRNDDQELMFALVNGVHHMADQISTANAILATEQGQWSIDVTITKLLGASDYTRCLEYLQNVSLVNAVDVLGAKPGVVHFRLQLNASPEHLAEAFERGSTLLPAKSGVGFEYEFLR